MKRREFITLIGGAAAWPLAVRAQQPDRLRRIGALLSWSANDPESLIIVGAFVYLRADTIEPAFGYRDI